MSLITSTSALTAPEVFCLSCVRSLESHPLAPENFRRKTSTLDRIQSEDNMSAWSMIDCIFPAKDYPTGADNLPKVILEGETGFSDNLTPGDCSEDVCTTGSATSDDRFRLELVIDQCDHEKFTITVDDFNAICTSPSERWARQLRKAAYNLKRRKNRLLISLLYAEAQNYPVSGDASSGATTQTVPMLTTDANINAVGYSKILSTYRVSGYEGELMTFGGETLASYGDVKSLTGSQFQDGSRPDPFENQPFVYDRDLDSVIQPLQADTDSYAMTIPMGSVGVVNWYENEGYNEMSMPHYIATTITIDGEKYDYWVRFEECPTPRYTVMLRQRWAMPVIPSTHYVDDEPLKLLWKIGCADADCNTPDPA